MKRPKGAGDAVSIQIGFCQPTVKLNQYSDGKYLSPELSNVLMNISKTVSGLVSNWFPSHSLIHDHGTQHPTLNSQELAGKLARIWIKRGLVIWVELSCHPSAGEAELGGYMQTRRPVWDTK